MSGILNPTKKVIEPKKLKKNFKLSDERSVALAYRFIIDFINRRDSFTKIMRSHKRGFTHDTWIIYGLNDNNYKEYLSQADYEKISPINGMYAKWVEDKLTLKYILSGGKFDKYMPEYYAQIDENGNVYPIFNGMTMKINEAEDILTLLKQKTELAFKPIAGARNIGFFKLEYRNGTFLINDQVIPKDELVEYLQRLRSYLICEFLHPHPILAAYSHRTTNTIRYLLGRDSNGNKHVLGRAVRIGTKLSGSIEGRYVIYPNEHGEYKEAYFLDFLDIKSFRSTKFWTEDTHRDNGNAFKGKIPLWNELERVANEIADYLPQLKYMGFDFVVTDKDEIKLLEINNQTMIEIIQIGQPLLRGESKHFFDELLQ